MAYGRCRVDMPVHAMYPDVTGSRVPRNAVFVFALDGMLDAELVLDRSYRVPPTAAEGAGRFRFDVGGLLEPGVHELLFGMAPDDDSTLPVEPDSFELRFEVDAEPAPLPDETTSVRITRVARYTRKYGYVYRHFDEAIAQALSDAADCSAHVAAQTNWCRTSSAPGPRRGDYHVTFEVEGPAIGFSINDRFLPSHCRSAFFEESTFQIQAITETGLGMPREFVGDIEVGVEDDGPASALYGQPTESWTVCGFVPPVRASTWSSVLGAALIASACVARRAATGVAAKRRHPMRPRETGGSTFARVAAPSCRRTIGACSAPLAPARVEWSRSSRRSRTRGASARSGERDGTACDAGLDDAVRSDLRDRSSTSRVELC